MAKAVRSTQGLKKTIAENIERNFGVKENTPEYREALVKYVHYMHIMDLIGAESPSGYRTNDVFPIVKEHVYQENDPKLKREYIVKLNLISGHVSAWNISHYHYERATKALCMMMVTLMDYIIQEQGGTSILYDGVEKAEYYSLLKEMAHLNGEYSESYLFIYVFDYCTKKIGSYVGVQAYADVSDEHERIVESGNPQRVSTVLQRLKMLSDKNQADVMREIDRTYTPEPQYTEAQMETCYKEAVRMYGSEEAAMGDYTGLVAVMADLYTKIFKQ